MELDRFYTGAKLYTSCIFSNLASFGGDLLSPWLEGMYCGGKKLLSDQYWVSFKVLLVELVGSYSNLRMGEYGSEKDETPTLLGQSKGKFADIIEPTALPFCIPIPKKVFPNI